MSQILACNWLAPIQYYLERSAYFGVYTPETSLVCYLDFVAQGNTQVSKYEYIILWESSEYMEYAKFGSKFIKA